MAYGAYAAIGYERMAVPARPEKLRIRISTDIHNNVGRMCTNSSVRNGRLWIIRVPMRDQHYNRFYLVQHIGTGELRIESVNSLGNLY